ncbi:hypothetical protein BsWGS_16980 [Bradybaena similaris]
MPSSRGLGSRAGLTRSNTIIRGLPKKFPIILSESFIGTAAQRPEINRRRTQSFDSHFSPRPSHTTPDRPYEPDYNIMSESVVNLNSGTFENYIKGKEKALIVFYKNFQCQHIDFEAEFASIAEGSTNPKHGFGAVDCCMNRGLCAQEKICCTPVLKLYSNGFELGSVMSAANINATQMNMMVKMTPVLKKPKTNKQKKLVSQWFVAEKQTYTDW